MLDKSPGSPAHPVKGMRFSRRKDPAEPVHAVRRTGRLGPRFNYELFNLNNFNIRYWSWNYRGCWHQTCPPITRKSPVSVFIVTTSPCRDWVICAPAAFLGCSSRFSGSFSGVEP
ncbi:hypothetical protein VTJ49DRAFT_6440 [Mycothermus thermophilus]|uniref:Uncharacterized protein n=1 Tax=Humicola insolens TaxID=85995 RepID=A0ABR3V1I1_HUMIN